MAAKHGQGSSTGRIGGVRTIGRRWRVPALLLVSTLIGTAITIGAAAPSASAADTKATLTLTGVTSNTYPVGGNTVWVQPGSALTIAQSPINISANQGLLGTVSTLVGKLLGGLLKPQIVGLKATVDLSSVQRGTQNLTSGQSVATPALPKGVYPIAWSFTAVTALGQNVALNGNQLNPLGIKLNAKNQYVGYIVSDTKSPCGGTQCISLQTPTLSVAPSLPVVGQLPTASVPGQNVNIPVPSVPGVNAPLPGQSSTSTAPGSSAPGSTAPGSTSTTTSTNPYGYNAPGCTGPCAVVPKGGGSGGSVGNAYDVTLGQIDDPAAAGSGATGSGSGDGSDTSLVQGGDRAGSGAQQIAVDRAFSGTGAGGDSAPGLPTTLTLAAVAALAASSVLWFARRRLARR